MLLTDGVEHVHCHDQLLVFLRRGAPRLVGVTVDGVALHTLLGGLALDGAATVLGALLAQEGSPLRLLERKGAGQIHSVGVRIGETIGADAFDLLNDVVGLLLQQAVLHK